MISLNNNDFVKAAGDGLNGAELAVLAQSRSRARKRDIHVEPPCTKRSHPKKHEEHRTDQGDYWAGFMAGFQKNALIAQQAERDLKAALALAEVERQRLARVVEQAQRLEGALKLVDRVDEPSLARIVSRVLWLTGIAKKDFLSDRRAPGIVLAKAMFCHLACEHTSRSLPEIGKFWGNRDHTTVLHHRNNWKAKKAKIRAKR